MKLEKMQEICDRMQAPNMNGCCRCPLFTTILKNGCLKNHRYEIVEQYKKYKAENNEIMALKTMNNYKDLEGKVINKQ